MAATGLVFSAPPVFAKKNPCPDRKAPEKNPDKKQPDRKPPIVIGKRVDDIESFDPHESVSSSAAEIIGNLYETLAVWNPDKKTAEPNRRLVLSCDHSADLLNWTFVLERKLRFASGNEITPEDVVFSFERLFVINGAAASIFGPLGPVFGQPKSPFQVVDGNVKITLPPGAPGRLLLPCLTASVCSVIDKQLLQAHYAVDPVWAEAAATSPSAAATTTLHDYGRTWLKLNSAGSGPFKIAEIDVCDAPESPEIAQKGEPILRNDEIVLRANSNYPGNSDQTRSVIVRHIADPVEQKRQLDRQDIQVAWNLSFPQRAEDKSGTLIPAPKPPPTPAANLLLLCMNVGNKDAHLDSKSVRQAVRCAIDVKRLAEDLNSHRWSPQHEFCPSVLCQDSAAQASGLGTASPFNRDQARSLLEQAGIKNRLELTIDHISGNPRSHVATLLANQLDAAGFRIKLQPSDGGAFLNRLQRREYQLALLTWSADYPDPQSNAFTFCANSEIENRNSVSQQRTLAWYCRWLDDHALEIAKAAAEQPDGAERLKKYTELQNRLQETGPFAFLQEERRIVAVGKSGPAVKVGMLDNFTRFPTQTN
jgi:peptide/nickel transport system substrate-binding protein